MLKKCSLCGGNAASHTGRDFISAYCYIKCKQCKAQTQVKYGFWASDARKNAEEDWDLGIIR